MNYIARKLRTSIWLTQSFLGRYKRHFIFAFGLGSIIVLAVWQVGPTVFTIVFPERRYIGIIGQYEPSRLPSAVEKKMSSGLVSISDTGEIEPALATNWEVNKDGTLYFFHLKKNISWHDGQPFTAHDVNYRFREVLIAPGDSHILKIELEEPFSPLPTLLTKPLFKTGLVGVGEYSVVSIDLIGNTVEKIILKPFDNPLTLDINEAADKPILEYRFYISPSKAMLAYKLGEIDTIENLPGDVDIPDEPNNIIVETVQRDRFMALFYNLDNEALSSKPFRQALSYAAPPVKGKHAISPIPDTSWAHNGTVKEYRFNQDLAKTLLEKSDTPADAITLAISTFAEYLDTAQDIATAWEGIGVHTEVKVVQAFPSEYDVFLGVQEIPSDPDQYALWHSTQNLTNITRYNNPKIDKLLEEGRKETDKDARLEIYLDFQRYIAEDVPARILTHPAVYSLSRK
jgi:peptide/nickel transport system substrate-binding protein